MANLSNINNKFIVTDGGNVLIGNTANSSGRLQIKDTQTSSFNDGLAITRNNAAQTGYINMVGGAFNFNSPGLSYKFRNNGMQTLELNSSGNATFAGTVIGTTARFDTLNNSANSNNLIYRNSSGAKTVVGGGPTPDKIYILDGGNVGIGASLPGAKLDVVGSGKFQPGIADGDALVTIAQTNTNAYVHAGIKINAGNTNPFYIYQSGSSNTLRFNYNSLADAGGQLVITDSGNVGIGTTSPDSLLTVSGSSLQNSNNAGIELSNSHNAQTVLLIENTTSRKYEVAVGGSANSIGNGSFYIYDGTAGAARLVIDSSGNVGIGTNSPGRKLTVTGDASGDANNLLLSNENDTNGDSASIGFSMLSNNTYVKSGIFFERTTTQGRGSLHLAVNNEVNGNNVTKSDAKLTINNVGNVGIGTTSPTVNKLQVEGSIVG